MKLNYKKFLAQVAGVAFFIVLIAIPHLSFAQAASTGNTTPLGSTGNVTPAGSTGTVGLSNPLNATSLQGLISEILGYAIQIGTIFLTIMLIYVGFQFVAARGNEEKIQSARSALLWTVIGGLLLVGAQAIAIAIANTAGAL